MYPAKRKYYHKIGCTFRIYTNRIGRISLDAFRKDFDRRYAKYINRQKETV